LHPARGERLRQAGVGRNPFLPQRRHLQRQPVRRLFRLIPPHTGRRSSIRAGRRPIATIAASTAPRALAAASAALARALISSRSFWAIAA